MHNASFIPVFTMEISFQVSFRILKQSVCHADVSLHSGSHLVLHVRAFKLNCYNEVTCRGTFFVGPAEFVIKAFDPIDVDEFVK